MAAAPPPSSSDNTPIQSIENPKPQKPRVDGTYIIYYKDGKLWPVVICDESLVPPTYMAKNWTPDDIPVIILGMRTIKWFSPGSLMPEYDPTSRYDYEEIKHPDERECDSLEERSEKLRCKAFTQDVGSGNDAKAWVHVIVQRDEARKLQKARKSSSVRSSTKRKSSRSEYGDYEDHGRSSKKARKDSIMNSSPPSRHRDSGSQLPTPKTSPTEKQRQNALTIRLKKQAELDESKPIPGVETPTEAERSRVEAAFNAPRLDTMCEVHVGPKDALVPFVVNRRLLYECEFLRKFEAQNTKGIWAVDLSAIDEGSPARRITPQEFMPIFDYFRTGKVEQHLTRAQKLNPSDDNDQLEWVIYLARAFMTARKIQHVPHQELVFKKLQMLPQLDSLSIIFAATYFKDIGKPENVAEKGIKGWIRFQFTLSYDLIAKNNGAALKRLFEDDRELWKDVGKSLAENPEAGKMGLPSPE